MERLGTIFKIHRKNNNYSLDYVASASGINRGKISLFENDKANMDKKSITKIYECIGIEYKTDIVLEKETSELVNNIYYDLLYGKKADELFGKLFEDKTKIMCSERYITYLLGVLLMKLYTNDFFFDYSFYIENIYKNRDMLSKQNKQIMFDCIGLYNSLQNNNQESEKFYKKGLEYNINQSYEAMIRFHYGFLLMHEGKLTDALDNFKRSNYLFGLDLNFYRMMDCTVYIAGIYGRLSYVNKMLDIHYTILNALDTTELSNDIKMIIINTMIMDDIYTGQFEQVIEINKKYNFKKINNKTGLVLLAYIYWNQNDINRASYYLKNARKINETGNKDIENMIEVLISLLLKKDFDLIERKIYKLFKQKNFYFDYIVKIFSLKLLIKVSELYEENDKKEKYELLLLKYSGNNGENIKNLDLDFLQKV